MPDPLPIAVSHEPPPAFVAEACGSRWGARFEDGWCFTYGGTLHVHPDFAARVDDAFLAHERTHVAQQAALGPDVWWHLYLRDDDFRLSQEAEAYRAQYRAFCRQTASRFARFRLLMALARDLSGPAYGRLVSSAEALKIIGG